VSQIRYGTGPGMGHANAKAVAVETKAVERNAFVETKVVENKAPGRRECELVAGTEGQGGSRGWTAECLSFQRADRSVRVG
jgi:hypothetical protein